MPLRKARSTLPAVPAVSATDLLFAQVGLLLPLQSDFGDRSQFQRTITSQGVSMSSNQAKFGSQAAKFSDSSYLSFSGATGLNLPGDFAIELWVYQVSRPREYAPLLETLENFQVIPGYSLALQNGKLNFFDGYTQSIGQGGFPNS